jgi:hypothetical protein
MMMKASVLSAAVALAFAGGAVAEDTAKDVSKDASKDTAKVEAKDAAKDAAKDETKGATKVEAKAAAPCVYDSPDPPAPAGEIDRIVFSALSARGIQPVLCSDAVFVRRAYLDVIGTLPGADEVRNFLQDPDAKDKRRLLIDRLLERKEYADYWAMRWSDILRIKAEFPVNLWPNAAQAYHRWVRESIAGNKPYDAFARELLTSSGSNFRVGPVNFYRAVQSKTPDAIAGVVALTFMGVRTDMWPPERQKSMAVFFSQIGYKPTSEWKEENVFWDPLHAAALPGNTAPGQAAISMTDKAAGKAAGETPAPPAGVEPPTAVFPDGARIPLSPDRDPREVFADWLVTPKNPWFTRCIVNRVWAWMLGRGIIHEPDDIREDNPPSHPRLLAYLEKEMAAGGYDLKRLYRLILNSGTYQLSSIPRGQSPDTEAFFATYPIRRLDAEVLIDAINKITGMSEFYSSPIPEPFTNIPRDKPAIAIADGSITSPFLALFGRPARATGMLNERDNKPLPAQWLHLLNSSHIQQKIEQSPALKAIIGANRKPRDVIEDLFLTILSRLPTDDEVKHAETYSATSAAAVAAKPAKPPAKAVTTKRREEWLDIIWALMNSTEFLYRH